MTREEKIKILEAAQERAYGVIDKTCGEDLSSDSFGKLLHFVQQMDWMLAPGNPVPLKCAETDEPEELEEDSPKNLPKVVNTRVGDKMYTEVVQPAPEEPAAAEADTPQYAMTEVRAALAKARGRGVNVSAIISSFGVENFPQLSKEHYPAVMAKLAEEG